MVSMERAEPVANLSASVITIGSIGKRRIEAVEVPMSATLIASNNLVPAQRRERTIVAQNSLPFGILCLEVIRQLFVSSSSSVDYRSVICIASLIHELRSRSTCNGTALVRMYIILPSLGSKLFYELAIFSGCDAIKVFANVLREHKI